MESSLKILKTIDTAVSGRFELSFVLTDPDAVSDRSADAQNWHYPPSYCSHRRAGNMHSLGQVGALARQTYHSRKIYSRKNFCH
jgi:hypothetical protein